MRALRLVVCAVLFGVWLPVPVAAAFEDETTCQMGGPAPGFRALTFELPQGSDVLVLTIDGRRGTRPVNDEASWHLAQGIILLDAQTLDIVAHQVDYAGTAPAGTVFTVDGAEVAAGSHPAPEGPFLHGSRLARSGLPPGRYHVVAFGTGGGPRQWWGASISLSGHHSCVGAPTAGETFDFDHTGFEGGTQVYTPGIGYAENISLSFTSDRSVVAGLIDVAVQASTVGSATMDYTIPTGSGSLSRQIVPFVSTGGDYHFEASYRGAFPIVAVAGAAVDLP